MKCRECEEEFEIECGRETPKHGYCPHCASAKLDEVLGDALLTSLPASERHLTPTAHKGNPNVPDLAGWWVQAPALGCVRPELAAMFAGEIMKLLVKLKLGIAVDTAAPFRR